MEGRKLLDFSGGRESGVELWWPVSPWSVLYVVVPSLAVDDRIRKLLFLPPNSSWWGQQRERIKGRSVGRSGRIALLTLHEKGAGDRPVS